MSLNVTENGAKTLMKESAKAKILDTASRLFYERGIHATGIDTVVAESGVTKMTLYKHFASKQELILATLRQRDEAWRAWFQETVEARAASPDARLLALFDVLDIWFQQADFLGCPFLKAVSEYCATEHPIHQEASLHYHKIRLYIQGLAEATTTADAAGLVDGLYLLLIGATAAAFAVDDPQSGMKARDSARELLASHGIALRP